MLERTCSRTDALESEILFLTMPRWRPQSTALAAYDGYKLN